MTSVFDDHLNLDAIVAYADGEMSLVAYQRASAHLQRCPQCSAEVREQQAARSWLRSAGSPTMPLSLFNALRSIPTTRQPSASSRSTVAWPMPAAAPVTMAVLCGASFMAAPW